MKKFLLAIGIVVGLVASAREGRAEDSDPWLGRDKALHFGASAVIGAGGYAVGTAIFDARGHAMLFGAGLALAVGAGKELLDMTGFGDPSWKDFAWDAMGAATGVAVAWGIDLLVRGVSPKHPLLALEPLVRF